MELAINDDYNIICVTKPTNTLEIPEVRTVPGLYNLCEEQIQLYFEAIFEQEIRISCINGIKTNMDFSEIKCHYCNELCEDDIYYYCDDCQFNICDKCDDKISELVCGTHESEIREINKDDYTVVSCDICFNLISGEHKFSNDDVDICYECSQLDSGKKIIQNLNLEMSENKIYRLKDTLYNFGSMLDWIPILHDDEGNFILFNYNKDSLYSERLGIVSMDESEKCGFYLLPEDAHLDILLTRLEELNNDEEWLKLEGLDRFYNFPIKRIMHLLNMKIYYD